MKGALISWWDTSWVPGRSGSCRHTGIGCRWWQRLEANSPPPFKGYYGVTQGDPLYTTIFNMLVDAIIRHWVTVVAPMEARAEGLKEII